MTSISPYLIERYSEELYPVSEAEFDEVMRAPAVEEEWPGYFEWSEELDPRQEAAPSTLYIDPKDGKVKQVPEPKSLGRISGIEL